MFSTRDLGIRGPGVIATACTAAESAYRFRHDGLVLQPGGQGLLLPGGAEPP